MIETIENKQPKDREIYRYQFLLNYLNLKQEDRINYIWHELEFIENY